MALLKTPIGLIRQKRQRTFVDLNGRITVSGSPFIEAQQDRGGAAHDPLRPDDAMGSPSKPNKYLSQRRSHYVFETGF
jgi:hypothetical protein